MKHIDMKKLISILLALCVVTASVLFEPAQVSAASTVNTTDRYRWTKANSYGDMAKLVNDKKSVPVLITFDSEKYYIKLHNGTSAVYANFDAPDPKFPSTGEIKGFSKTASTFITTGGDYEVPYLEYIDAGMSSAGKFMMYDKQSNSYLYFGCGDETKYYYKNTYPFHWEWVEDGGKECAYMIMGPKKTSSNDVIAWAKSKGIKWADAGNTRDETVECYGPDDDYRYIIENVSLDYYVWFTPLSTWSSDKGSRHGWKVGMSSCFSEHKNEGYLGMSRGGGGGWAYAENCHVYCGEPVPYIPINSNTTWGAGQEETHLISDLCIIKSGVTLEIGKYGTCVVSGQLINNGKIKVKGRLIITGSGCITHDSNSAGSNSPPLEICDGGSLVIMEGGLVDVPGDIQISSGCTATVHGSLLAKGKLKYESLITLGSRALMASGACFTNTVAVETQIDHAGKRSINTSELTADASGGYSTTNGIIDNSAGGMIVRYYIESSTIKNHSDSSARIIRGAVPAGYGAK